MKFDYIVGNPPYQESRDTTKDMPVYNSFMDSAFELSDRVLLITPGRFLFNAGATPKAWNLKMLNDEHFKVCFYEPDSSKVFPGTDIKGGIAITYRSKDEDFGAIGMFTSFNELNSIRYKVENSGFESLATIIYSPAAFKFSEKFHEDNPGVRYHEIDGEPAGLLSKGNDYMIATNVFDKLSDYLTTEVPNPPEDYAQIVGLLKGKREKRYIKKEYVDAPDSFNRYKVILPESNGSGSLGEALSTPVVGAPYVGHTQSFISIGSFSTEDEAAACMKYIKTRFARVMLGIKKITQHNQRPVWEYVPLQDFSCKSDIDWKDSISDIDVQLYKKYGLDDKEIKFIETHVKEME